VSEGETRKEEERREKCVRKKRKKETKMEAGLAEQDSWTGGLMQSGDDPSFFVRRLTATS
jgi:hypothetical protein